MVVLASYKTNFELNSQHVFYFCKGFVRKGLKFLLQVCWSHKVTCHIKSHKICWSYKATFHQHTSNRNVKPLRTKPLQK